MLSNLLNGGAVALILAANLFGNEISNGTAPSAAPPSVVVDRTLKKDLSVPAEHSLRINGLLAPTSSRELVDGCESLVSPLTYSPLARIVGRCLS
jgi:hypothetical protein